MAAYRSLRHTLALIALLTAGVAVTVIACSEPPTPVPPAQAAGDPTPAPSPDPVQPAPVGEPVKPVPAGTPVQPTTVEAATLAFQLHPTLGELCRVTAPKAYFEYDSAKLTWGDAVVIEQVVDCLNREDMRDAELRVVGRASVTGPAKYNRELALDRARAVADGLVKAGLSRERMTLVSRGEKGFAVPQTTAGLAFQRRVDLQLADPTPATVAVTYWDVDADARMNAGEFYTHTADLLGLDGYDRDEDGGLDPSEMAAFVFNAWDGDRDKALDEDEWGFGTQGWYPGQKPFGAFEAWDTDDDGRVTPVEWLAVFLERGVIEKWDLDGDRMLYDHEVAVGLFRMYDGNGDGLLDAREAKQIRAWGFGEAG